MPLQAFFHRQRRRRDVAGAEGPLPHAVREDHGDALDDEGQMRLHRAPVLLHGGLHHVMHAPLGTKRERLKRCSSMSARESRVGASSGEATMPSSIRCPSLSRRRQIASLIAPLEAKKR